MRLARKILFFVGMLKFSFASLFLQADGESRANKRLIRFAMASHLEGMTDAIEAGADINFQDRFGMTALSWVAYNQIPDGVKFLLLRGADPNLKDLDGKTALNHGVRSNIIVKLLRSHKANPNLIDNKGVTALMRSAEVGNRASLRLLLKVVKKVDARDDDGWTALHWAAFQGKEDCLATLLRAGAKINKQDLEGRTALMKASSFEKSVRLLVNQGADIHLKDKDNWTALHWASFSGKIACVTILVEAGAKKKVKDVYRKTPQRLAAEKGYRNIIGALRSPSKN